MAPQILQGKNCTLISLVGCEIVEDAAALSAVTGNGKACILELLVLLVACWVVVWFGVENCEVEISQIEEKIDEEKIFMFKIKTILYAKFGNKINLKTKSDSEESGEQPILCQYCDKEYLGKRNLMAHIKRMHRIQDEGFEQGNLLRGIDNSSVCGASP